MNLEMAKSMVKTAGEVIRKNSPHILTALGAAGVVGTAVSTGKAVRNASEKIAENDLLDKKDIAKECWSCFVPPVLIGTASIACIIGADCVNTKRQAALYALYSAAVESAKEYEDKVKEMFGEGKEKKVRDSIAQDRVTANPDTNATFIPEGMVKCYDEYSGRYFASTPEKIRKVQNDLNHTLISEMWVSVNDLYYELGMNRTKDGDEKGWNTDRLIEIDFSSCLDENGKPCLVIDYDTVSRYDYRTLM